MTENISRRRALQLAAGGAASSLVVGSGAAEERPPERVVGTTGRRGAQAARNEAESVRRTLDFGSIGRAVSGRFSDEAVERLRRRNDVRYVEENGEMRALEQTTPYGISKVDADLAISDGNTADGVSVAVIDTGIDAQHEDLQDNLGQGKAIVSCSTSGGCLFGGGNDISECLEPWDDDNDHGSHCAGTVGAIDNSTGVVGVGPDVTLHAVKVLDRCGSGSYDDIAAGIKWSADQGHDVQSMSLGGSSSSTVKDAVQYAADKNVVMVAAAGNDGPCSDCISYPAAYQEVIAVSATDQNDQLADCSSTGPEVELAAPGVDVESTVPRSSYDIFSGTSMACPHVSGGAAQVVASGVTDRSKVRQQLKDAADDVGLSSNEQGAGRLNVNDAIGSTDAAPSVSWVNPSGGDTVSGTVTVRISASDSEDSDDSLDVTYSVDGGSARSTTYNSTSGCYEDSWDTTTVSDGDHALEASATDSAGNTSTSSITVTTDNTESSPTVDSLSASEVETSDGDAEFDVDWSVSDGDGDLSTVDLTLTDDTVGETDDTASVGASGDTDSGTTRLVAAGDDGSGNSYTVDATVTDSGGNTGSGSTTVSETESTNAAPAASIDALTNDSNPRWDRYEVDWSASDSDGNLDTVVVEMLDSGGSTLDSVTNDVSRSSASGVDEVRSKSNGTDIVVTATDTDGASGSDSRSI
jgi:subtilisin